MPKNLTTHQVDHQTNSHGKTFKSKKMLIRLFEYHFLWSINYGTFWVVSKTCGPDWKYTVLWRKIYSLLKYLVLKLQKYTVFSTEIYVPLKYTVLIMTFDRGPAGGYSVIPVWYVITKALYTRVTFQWHSEHLIDIFNFQSITVDFKWTIHIIHSLLPWYS